MTLKLIIVAIILAEFFYSRTLSLLNLKASRSKIPEELDGIYDKTQYIKQQEYMTANVRMGLFDSFIGLLLTLWLFAFGGYALFDEWTHSNSLLFFGAIFTFSTLLELPLSAYDVFGIEARFGFNKRSWGLFLKDQLTSYLMSLILGGVIIYPIMLIYEHMPHMWFAFLAWGLVIGFGLFMSFFYSDLIVPLFNKQTPLEDGELRTAIFDFARKADMKIKEIYVIDGSKRSTKANAYFAGFGSRKRIVLFDTLISQLSTDEIVAVLGHEMGHQKHKHVLLQQLISAVLNLFVFLLVAFVLDSDAIAQAAGLQKASFHVNLLVFTLLYEPVSMLVDMLSNYVSRRCEYQADAFVKQMGMAESLISALKKISGQALSNLTPHPLKVFMEYSHPTLLSRIRALRS